MTHPRLRTMTVYKLKTNQPRQTNHKLKCVKVFLCGSVYNTLFVMIREEVTRFVIFISRVKIHLKSQKSDPPRRHISNLQTLPCATLTSNPLDEPVIEMFLFHHEIAHDTTFDLSQLMVHGFRTPFDVVCLEAYLVPRDSNSLPPRGSKMPSSSSLVWPFSYLFCSRKTFSCFAPVRLSLFLLRIQHPLAL